MDPKEKSKEDVIQSQTSKDQIEPHGTRKRRAEEAASKQR